MTKLDNKCPACHKSADIDEATECDQYNCRECDAVLVAVAGDDNIMRLEIDPELPEVVDNFPLCAEVATIPVEDIQRLIETGRAVGFDETADRVEKWLKESVGSDIPF